MASSIESSIGNPKTSMALLKALAENSFDSILVTDATVKGKIIYANKAFKKLTGHEPSDVIGKTPRILQGVGTDKKVTERLSLALKLANPSKERQSITKRTARPSSCFGECVRSRLGRQSKPGLRFNEKGLSSDVRCPRVATLTLPGAARRDNLIAR